MLTEDPIGIATSYQRRMIAWLFALMFIIGAALVGQSMYKKGDLDWISRPVTKKKVEVNVGYPKPVGWVNDYANVINRTVKARMDRRITVFEYQTSVELVVVTVNSLNGKTLEEYARGLFDAWEIGKKDGNNGVLILLSMRERLVRVEVGYGLKNVLTDAVCRDIADKDMIPHFKRQQFGAGLQRGVEAVMERLAEN